MSDQHASDSAVSEEESSNEPELGGPFSEPQPSPVAVPEEELIEPVLGDQSSLADWFTLTEDEGQLESAEDADGADEAQAHTSVPRGGTSPGVLALSIDEDPLGDDSDQLLADPALDASALLRLSLTEEAPKEEEGDKTRAPDPSSFDLQVFGDDGGDEGVALAEDLALPELPPIDADATDIGLTLSLLDVGETELPDDDLFVGPDEPRFRLLATADGDFDCVTPSGVGALVGNTKLFRLVDGELKELGTVPHRIHSMVAVGPSLLLTTRAGHWYRASLDPTDPNIDDLERCLPEIPGRTSNDPLSLCAHGAQVIAYDAQGAAFMLDRVGRYLGVADGAFRGALRSPCGLAHADQWTAVVNTRHGLVLLGPALSDGVASHRIAGCSSARTACLGRVQEQLVAWTTLSEVGSQTQIIEIDVETRAAACVFRLPGAPNQEEVVISALAWDAPSRTLLVTSSTGFYALKRLEG